MCKFCDADWHSSLMKFKFQRSVHRKYILIYIQQDATLLNLFISGNCSTCFGWYLHQSSEAHTTVSIASGTCQTVTATCRYPGNVGVPTLPGLGQVAVTVWQVPNAVDTVVCAPDDGWRHHPKHVEQFTEINKLCNVGSRWICIRISLMNLVW